jgi:hypothetical protein
MVSESRKDGGALQTCDGKKMTSDSDATSSPLRGEDNIMPGLVAAHFETMRFDFRESEFLEYPSQPLFFVPQAPHDQLSPGSIEVRFG